MGKKQKARKKALGKAGRYGVVPVPPAEPEIRAQVSGSACWKCLQCESFRRESCKGLLEYWDPWCPRRYRTRATGGDR